MSDKVIKGVYKEAEHFEVKHVTGAFGGVNPTGDIVVNFYNEYNALPNEFSVNVDDNGNVVSDETFSGADYNVVRILQSGIVMKPGTAKAIADWLNDLVEEVENARISVRN